MKISLKQAKTVGKGESAKADTGGAGQGVDRGPKKSSAPATTPGAKKTLTRDVGSNGAAANADGMMNDKVPEPDVNMLRLTEALAARFPWDTVCDKVEELWNAKRPVAHHGVIIEWVPDCRIQAKMVELALAYREGRPVERSEIITREITSLDQVKESARRSPAYLRAMKRVLVEIEAEVAV